MYVVQINVRKNINISIKRSNTQSNNIYVYFNK